MWPFWKKKVKLVESPAEQACAREVKEMEEDLLMRVRNRQWEQERMTGARTRYTSEGVSFSLVKDNTDDYGWSLHPGSFSLSKATQRLLSKHFDQIEEENRNWERAKRATIIREVMEGKWPHKVESSTPLDIQTLGEWVVLPTDGGWVYYFRNEMDGVHFAMMATPIDHNFKPR